MSRNQSRSPRAVSINSSNLNRSPLRSPRIRPINSESSRSPPPMYLSPPVYSNSSNQQILSPPDYDISSERDLIYYTPEELFRIRDHYREQKKRIKESIRLSRLYNIYYTLIDAVMDDNLDAMRYLINNRQDVNMDNTNRNTPLHIAAERGYEGIVKLLVIQPGILIDRNNGEGETALFLALKNGNINIAKILLDRGADVNWKNYEGKGIMDVVGNSNLSESDKRAIDLLIADH